MRSKIYFWKILSIVCLNETLKHACYLVLDNMWIILQHLHLNQGKKQLLVIGTGAQREKLNTKL